MIIVHCYIPLNTILTQVVHCCRFCHLGGLWYGLEEGGEEAEEDEEEDGGVREAANGAELAGSGWVGTGER